MKQNIYDDPNFFSQYAGLPRSQQGLNAATEWTDLKRLLPPLENLNVLDLGCGYGWHCRYFKEEGASSVIGIDLSAKMLEKAQKENLMPGIQYFQTAIEDISLNGEKFDLVFSSLAFHYVKDFNSICQNVSRILKPGGHFIFSMEHPIYTSREQQDWIRDSQGNIMYWAVDHYHDETQRSTNWLKEGVIKYHRKFSSIINDLVNSGFRINHVSEPSVSREILQQHPEWMDENRRPIFLIIAGQNNYDPHNR